MLESTKVIETSNQWDWVIWESKRNRKESKNNAKEKNFFFFQFESH